MRLLLGWLKRRSAVFWIAAVAVGYAAAGLLIVPLDLFMSFDEALYSSQYSRSVPEMGLSAHRSPGMPLLLAPITSLTASTAAIRGYLTVLTSLGLFVAYRAWVPVDRRCAPLAAVLFAGWGVTLLNAHFGVPNLLTALGVVAAVGYFVRSVQGPRSAGVLVGLGAAFALVSLLRPTDSVFAAAPLAAAVLLVRGWRRPAPVLAGAAGLAVGLVAWLVEAWVSFGGPVARWTALRNITRAGNDPVLFQWIAASPWLTLAAAAAAVTTAVLVMVVARRVYGRPPAPAWSLAVAVAACTGLPYYLLLSYSNGRYLLPACGLLALPIAAGLCGLVTAWRAAAARNVACAAVVLALLAYVGGQTYSAVGNANGLYQVRTERKHYAERLHALGVRPPCVVSGYAAPALAFTLDCTAGDLITPVPSTASRTTVLRRDIRTARRTDADLVLVVQDSQRPAEVADWPRVRLQREPSLSAYYAEDP